MTPFRRPPVRQSTLVRCDAERTFESFVATIGSWWPVRPFSAGQERVADVTVEQLQGGRVYETWRDGTQVDWGTVTTWQPPERFVMTWTMTPVPSEVEFTFAALGPSLTRVAVEHRGWEAMTEQQLAQDCAVPGGYLGGGYVAGWATILGAMAEAVSADTPHGGRSLILKQPQQPA